MDQIKDDDIFFSFTYFNLDGQNPVMEQLKDKKFIKLFHIDHFNMRTSEIAKNAKRLGVDFFVAENNLSKNSKFFKKYFSFYKKNVYQLPFVFKPRFQKQKKFSDRKNKALATGTIIDINQIGDGNIIFKDFLNYYKLEYVQPLRFEIFKNKNKLKSVLDSLIGYLWDKKRKEIKGKPSLLKILHSKFYNAFVLAKRKYYKLDIVDEYNKYKMFVVPEEINDVPGIGFVEGMACGAAYIGKNDDMYNDLGMKPGYNYIGYDGTLKNLIKRIEYYQKHPKKLEQIAENGYQFVRTKLSPEVVSRKFWDDLTKLSKNFNKKNKRKVQFESISV